MEALPFRLANIYKKTEETNKTVWALKKTIESGSGGSGGGGGAVSGEQRAGLEAGGLMLQLMWDLHAVWSPQRSVPLKRKDYHYAPREGGGERDPLVRAAYLLPPDPCLEECPLPDE